SPCCTRIFLSTPDTGASTSISILSVSTLSSGSFSSTGSPSCLNQAWTVPSSMVMPSFGIVRSVATRQPPQCAPPLPANGGAGRRCVPTPAGPHHPAVVRQDCHRAVVRQCCHRAVAWQCCHRAVVRQYCHCSVAGLLQYLDMRVPSRAGLRCICSVVVHLFR